MAEGSAFTLIADTGLNFSSLVMTLSSILVYITNIMPSIQLNAMLKKKTRNFLKKILCIYLFSKRGKRRGKERERNIRVIESVAGTSVALVF